MDRREFLGLVGVGCLVGTLPELTSIALSQPVSVSCDIDVSTLPELTQKILKDFKSLPIYQKKINQDTEDGRGIYPCPTNFCETKEEDRRSEKPAYLPFVLAARRQTDALIRQGYQLLPESVRKNTAFLIADRFAQHPECYIPYIQKKKNVVIVGSFVGINELKVSTLEEEEVTAKNTSEEWRPKRHRLELKQLDLSIKLVQSLGEQVIDVVYAMGDSSSPNAESFRKNMQDKFYEILRSNNLDKILLDKKTKRPRLLAWGADEAIWKAFARQLPPMTVKIYKNNDQAKHFYDAKRTTKEMIPQILNELGIQETSGNTFDTQVFVFDRYPNDKEGHYDFKDRFPPDDPQQKEFDQDFINKIKSLPSSQHAKTIIIDARNPNGALNNASIPPSDKFLAFGSWGTFANVVGQTLAIAKILHFALRNAKSSNERQRLLKIQRQLLLEAVVHDVFVIGYGQAQDENSAFKKWQKDKNLEGRYIHRETTVSDCNKEPKKCLRYKDSSEVQQIYQQMEDFVNEQIPQIAPQLVGTTKFKIVPQIWRMFESQVYASDGELSYAGVYRTDLPEETFNPFKAAKNVKKFDLQDLINEFP
jgi:hypothetical protein